ncbi:hypothetical protein ABGB12_02635 [Actinocorallia sp. B10E7]|uniref:hypothetical protein n=1 Tax=Actinocorallia sp. B10E7 TaxID=3153558 RepID=UPI00325C7595
MPGDRYPLCTDGLTDAVPAQSVHEALTTCATPGDAVRRLLDFAAAEGAPGGITCVVVDAVPLEDQAVG